MLCQGPENRFFFFSFWRHAICQKHWTWGRQHTYRDSTETKQRGSLPFQHDLQQWAASSASGQHRFLISTRGSLPKHQHTDYLVRRQYAGEFAQWDQCCASILHEVTFGFLISSKPQNLWPFPFKLSYVIDRLLKQIACNRCNDFWVYFSSISVSFSTCIRDPHSVSGEPSFFFETGYCVSQTRLKLTV